MNENANQTTDSHASATNTSGTAERWWRRRKMFLPWLAVTGVLGLFQAAFLTWRAESFGGGWDMLFGLTQLGVMLAIVTMLLALPALLLLRRWHPAARRGEVGAASWSICCGAGAGLAAWTLGAVWAAGPWIPGALEPWFATAWALLVGLGAAWFRPPQRWISAAAVATLGLLIFVMLPLGNPPQGPGRTATGLDAEPLTAAKPRAGAPDVVLISIDTLRADRLAAYGGSRSLTPEMDRFVAEGVLFERALAASPWTVPSVASMLTGLPTTRHGAGLPSGSGPAFARSPLDGDKTTIAERFAAAGYRTRAVVANGFLSPATGMAQGFEQFVNPFASAGLVGMLYDLALPRLLVALTPPETWGDYRAEAVTDVAMGWLAEDDPEPLFLWVHYIDPHSPFQRDPAVLDTTAVMEMARQKQPPILEDGTVIGETFVATDLVRGGSVWLGAEDRLRLEQYYDGAVAYTDAQVGRLFAALRERRGDRQVLAALTADHGEEFWDHGHFEHGHDYYAEVTRIPLAFWGPGRVPAGAVVTDPAGLVDVSPTLLELAAVEGGSPEGPDEGRSLVASWQANASGERAAAPPRFAEGNLYGLPAALLEEGSWRYLLRANGVEELYDAAGDPRDRHDLSREYPELVARYRAVLEPRLAALIEAGGDGRPAEIDPEALEALRALGYIR